MNWSDLKSRLSPAPKAVTRGFVLPGVIIEVQPDFVAGAKLDPGQRQVRRMSVAELEPGAVNPHPAHVNLAGGEALRQSIERVTESIGNGGGPVGLLVSDGVVRAAVLPFDTVPETRGELDELVHWRMKEHLPFPPEEVRLSCQVSKLESGGWQVLALAACSTVLGEYELALKGRNEALFLPSTAALLPLLPQENDIGQLLVNLCSSWITSVLVQGSRVCSWRTREIIEVSPEEQVHAVGTEVGRVAASARDHLSVEIGIVWLCARPQAPAAIEREVSRATGRDVRVIKPGPELGGTLPAGERAGFERYGAPVAGLLMNASDS